MKPFSKLARIFRQIHQLQPAGKATAARLNTMMDPAQHTPGWLWLLPRISFIVFVLGVSTLVWFSNRTEQENQRVSLISDLLSLEQDLQFQLEHNAELLARTSENQISNINTFSPLAENILANQTGLQSLAWLSPQGEEKLAFPEYGQTLFSRDNSRNFAQLTSQRGSATYSQPFSDSTGKWLIEVRVPVYSKGSLIGLMSGTYSLDKLLESSLPWWLAERYHITVLDNSGTVLASRTKMQAPVENASHELAFDPPGHGLYIKATPYRSALPAIGSVISISLAILALIVLWSLWALRRHVSGRQQAEQALREEHAFRKAMEDSLDTGMRARDLAGRTTYVNPAFCRMFGWTAEELAAMVPPMPYWVDADLEATQALHNRILAGKGPRDGYEIRFKRKSGEVFFALVHTTPLINAQGQQTGWMSSIVDITQRKQEEELARQREERLQSSVRLITMGEMASSLAHELNQPLAAIASYNTGCLNLIASGQGDPKELEFALNKSAEQARRAGRIIRRIYEFVRRAEPKYESFEPLQLLEEICSFIDADARSKQIKLIKQFPPSLPIMTGDRVLLSQALLNLIRNAMDAVREQESGRRIVTLSANIEENALHISVSDLGNGIPVDVASRLFEPFFTTKSEGMGMGLNICRTVIEGHQGRLWHENLPHQSGSIFHIMLPLPGATA